MALKKMNFIFLVLAITRFDNYEVSAWIFVDHFRSSLTLSNSNKNKAVTFIDFLPTVRRMDSKLVSSSQLASKSNRRKGDDKDEDKIDTIFTISPNRRSFLEKTSSLSLFTTTGMIFRHMMLPTVALVVVPSPSHGKYGESSSMELPSYIDYLIEKNTSPNDSKALYQGADPATVLKRLSTSERSLGQISVLAEEKKWSQINGILTGPLGTLSMTMNQIVFIISSSNSPLQSPKRTKKVQEAIRKVKGDIVAIGQAADRKNAMDCTKQTDMASTDLKVLLEIAFD
mmetsp:Transcript_56651/g.65277  ORF Transcript_56651/g.65277 Transcript_56651/m.65277 type:complete len:285 (+) Transcript_56651:104-958(+)